MQPINPQTHTYPHSVPSPAYRPRTPPRTPGAFVVPAAVTQQHTHNHPHSSPGGKSPQGTIAKVSLIVNDRRKGAHRLTHRTIIPRDRSHDTVPTSHTAQTPLLHLQTPPQCPHPHATHVPAQHVYAHTPPGLPHTHNTPSATHHSPSSHSLSPPLFAL